MSNKTFSWEGRCDDGSGVRKSQFYITVDGVVGDLQKEIQGMDFLAMDYSTEPDEDDVFTTATIVVLADKKEEFRHALLEKGFGEA